MTVLSDTPHRSVPVALFVALRPRQWLKNVLVLAAPLAAGSLFVPAIIMPTLGAFVAFCLISSATYLINDARDVESDRAHPVKCHRPIAAGQLSRGLAWAAAAFIAILSLALSLSIDASLAAVVATYFVFTLSYTLFLKNEPVIELGLLAMGFLLRAIAGGVASNLPISQWFLIVAGFGSLFMAAGKRYSELDRSIREASGGVDEVNAGNRMAPDRSTRRSLAGYTLGYLRFVWATAAAVTITAYCLWAFEVAAAPSTLPWAQWSVLPFVLAILRYGVVVDKGEAEAPEEAILRDRVLLILGVAWVVPFTLGALGI